MKPYYAVVEYNKNKFNLVSLTIAFNPLTVYNKVKDAKKCKKRLHLIYPEYRYKVIKVDIVRR